MAFSIRTVPYRAPVLERQQLPAHVRRERRLLVVSLAALAAASLLMVALWRGW